MTVHPMSSDAYQLLHEGTLALARAERQGIRIDTAYVARKKRQLERKIAHLEAQFKDTEFFWNWEKSKRGVVNIDSDDQLAKYLYRHLGLKPVKLTATSTEDNEKGSTDEESLRGLEIPELNILLQKKKVKGVWDKLDGFERETVNGFMHPHFNLHLVTTFRSSSNGPNFQNIHKHNPEAMTACRQAIIPRDNHLLVELDYGQLEVRISATYNEDKKLISDILHGDMHGDAASKIFMINPFDKKVPLNSFLRKATKNGFVFPQFYGSYYANCAANICRDWLELPQQKNWKLGMGVELPSGERASDFMIVKGLKSFDKLSNHLRDIEDDFWHVRYRQYTAWKKDWWKKYQRTGFIDLKTGFRCQGFMTEKEAINYPIQGSAFHCLLWSFKELDRIMRREHWDTRLIGQIHDSILLDANPDELDYVLQIAKRVTCEDLLEKWKWITVPLEIDIDKLPVNVSWAGLCN